MVTNIANPRDCSFGQLVERDRIAAGRSVGEQASMLGISESSYRSFLNGQSVGGPSWGRLMQMASKMPPSVRIALARGLAGEYATLEPVHADGVIEADLLSGVIELASTVTRLLEQTHAMDADRRRTPDEIADNQSIQDRVHKHLKMIGMQLIQETRRAR